MLGPGRGALQEENSHTVRCVKRLMGGPAGQLPPPSQGPRTTGRQPQHEGSFQLHQRHCSRLQVLAVGLRKILGKLGVPTGCCTLQSHCVLRCDLPVTHSLELLHS